MILDKNFSLVFVSDCITLVQNQTNTDGTTTQSKTYHGTIGQALNRYLTRSLATTETIQELSERVTALENKLLLEFKQTAKDLKVYSQAKKQRETLKRLTKA